MEKERRLSEVRLKGVTLRTLALLLPLAVLGIGGTAAADQGAGERFDLNGAGGCRPGWMETRLVVGTANALVQGSANGTLPRMESFSLVPAPVYAVSRAARPFALNRRTVVVAYDDTRRDGSDRHGQGPARRAVDYLADTIKRSTGLDIRRAGGGYGGGSSCIVLRLTDDLSARIGAEGYALTADWNRITITARSEAGLFMGVQTLLQLFPAKIYSPTVQRANWTVPAGLVVDYPRYQHRGAMLDVVRRFYPVEDVKRYIDQVALLKINTLHLHLTDDQGWRLQIAAIPALTEIGGTTQAGWPSKPENKWYYTREQFADIVAYAKARFIEIVPEIEGPGHVSSQLASIPGLNCDDRAVPPYSGFDVGISALCLDDAHVGNVRSFLQTVIPDIAQQSQGRIVHIGGDEVPRSLGLERYNTYVGLASQQVAAAGRTVMGWHEIASGPIPAGTLLQYWATEAARARIGTADEGVDIGLVREGLAKGARFILSPADHAYIDMQYDTSTPFGLHWAGYTTVRESYDWEPAQMLSSLDGSISLLRQSDIAGVEGNLWSDRAYYGSSSLPTPDTVWPPPRVYADYMAFPRIASIAEIGWSPLAARSWDRFRTRLRDQGARWDAYGTVFFRSTEIDWR